MLTNLEAHHRGGMTKGFRWLTLRKNLMLGLPGVSWLCFRGKRGEFLVVTLNMQTTVYYQIYQDRSTDSIRFHSKRQLRQRFNRSFDGTAEPGSTTTSSHSASKRSQKSGVCLLWLKKRMPRQFASLFSRIWMPDKHFLGEI